MAKIFMSSPYLQFKSNILGVLHTFIGFCLIFIDQIDFFIKSDNSHLLHVIQYFLLQMQTKMTTISLSIKSISITTVY